MLYAQAGRGMQQISQFMELYADDKLQTFLFGVLAGWAAIPVVMLLVWWAKRRIGQ